MFYNFVLLGWNGRDCVNGQKSTPWSRQWNNHAGSRKSTLWSRHPASENAAHQSLSSISPEEDDVETDSCKSCSPAVSSQLLKHSSSIVGAVPQNPKFTSYRATNTSSKVRTKFLTFHVKWFDTKFVQINKINLLLAIWFVAMWAIMCMDAYALQDIQCRQVFEAAHKGDAASVESLLLQHSLGPDLANMVSNIITSRCMLYHNTTWLQYYRQRRVFSVGQ